MLRLMKLRDLLDPGELEAAIAGALVRRQHHPSAPLAILNYTERCAYERAWSDVTRQCRGLIYDTGTGDVVARPFPKFFNYGESPDAAFALDEPVMVTDKMDGSLGILYWLPGGRPAIATRGSFASEQAAHASALFRERYEQSFAPAAGDGLTHLFEVVYPANRIVVDYGGVDDLFYLGCVDIETGRTHGPDAGAGWPGPKAEAFECLTLAHALELQPRPNAEGIVVHFLDSDQRVKVKQEDYVALHRLVTGMNARVVWERIGQGETADSLCQGIPEEFWPWVRQVAAELEAERARVTADAAAEHERILAGLPDGWGRKDYALAAVQSPSRPWLFNLLDGRDPAEGIWRTLKPSGERTLVAYREDTA
jgi:RNA ligase